MAWHVANLYVFLHSDRSNANMCFQRFNEAEKPTLKRKLPLQAILPQPKDILQKKTNTIPHIVNTRNSYKPAR